MILGQNGVMLQLEEQNHLSGVAQMTGQASQKRRLAYTALHQAVMDCRLDQVRLLVQKCNADVNSRDLLGRTPLMLCCLLDRQAPALTMARLFIKAGAKLDIKDAQGRMAISYGCLYGRESLVAAILKGESADLSEPDNDGNTPLHHAAEQGSSFITESLLRQLRTFSASADPRNAMGYTPLILACKFQHWHAAAMLLILGNASGFLRENEYFFNALEWLRHSETRQLSEPPAALRTTKSAGYLLGNPKLKRDQNVFLTERSTTCLLNNRFYKELNQPIARDGVHLHAFPRIPSSAGTLLSKLPTRVMFLSKFGGLRHDDEMATCYAQQPTDMDLNDEDEFEASRVKLLSDGEARDFVRERLENQNRVCSADVIFGKSRAVSRNSRLSRPGTVQLQRIAPLTRNSASQNLRHLLNLYCNSQNTLKSAEYLSQNNASLSQETNLNGKVTAMKTISNK